MIINNFLTVAQQIVILFLLIFAGFFCGKKKLFTDSGIKTCTSIVLYLAVPCTIINSYIREFSPELMGDLLISLGLSLAIHIVGIIIAVIAYPPKKKTDKTAVCHFATIFSNAGYMALPLQQAILGDTGVFFGASYVAVFNVFCWTYGLLYMEKESGNFSLKKLINPGTVSLIIGLIIFLFSIKVHPVLKGALVHLGNLNTPLPMLIIGYYLASCNLKETIKTKEMYPVTFLRLVLVPVVCLAIMILMGFSEAVVVSMTIAASAPVAANTTIFSVLTGRDEKLSVKLVSFTTLASIITMPLIVALAKYFL